MAEPKQSVIEQINEVAGNEHLKGLAIGEASLLRSIAEALAEEREINAKWLLNHIAHRCTLPTMPQTSDENVRAERKKIARRLREIAGMI